MNYRTKGDGLTDAIERLRAELGVIKEELRVIDLRKPALESRATRITEALSTLIGDGSTGDPRWMSLPRITELGLEHGEQLAAGSPDMVAHRSPGRPAKKVGPLKKPEISEDALIAMSYYVQRSNRPVKSSELYEHLVAQGLMERIDTEMPYKSFAITLRNIRQDYIEYDRGSKTWTLRDRSPKTKLREALEKGDGTRIISSHQLTVNREDNLFVRTVLNIFKSHRFESLSAMQVYDELTENRDYALIPGAGNLNEFTTTMEGYKDFFPIDESGLYHCTRQDLVQKPADNAGANAGAPGLYTVKHNGGVAV
ncbi:MAG: hypothetical protein Q8922_13170 [Bacteroidota bacterium]|nr:hypothetical protein [Bacteroidota bacterium]MDP4232770.1 hypothetical protein [Bacteroidota bacterium]MDP4242548.1 hypothetical protein [Bacteroidota bacterium]MDP4288873.1 hypothetical protein [Bacteroidota bacterium]